MRIAIIGSGIAGMTSAYLLSEDHEVVVYEANDYIGGHTNTADVSLNGQQYAVDTGFIVLNEKTYPNFIKLMNRLGVGWQDSVMSFSVESSPAIGGVMAQLDKTFPTNDCAMCILSPKLVECGRHLNIHVLTYAELEGLEGEPGNFVARVRKKPRYVVADECTGCGDCASACPVVRPDVFNVGMSARRAAYKLYPQAIPNAYVIEKRGRAPCREACPIHQRAQGYVALIAEGRFADAYRTIREDNPFPSICGRICNHTCEEACSRRKLDAPVNIMRLKRFVAEWALSQPESEVAAAKPRRSEEPSGKRVAVVGSGPAGLTCAQDLALAGHAVTVLEALPVPGGMLRVGIPSYRLPAGRVAREIDDILALGIDLRLNERVEDAVALLEDGYDAAFVAVGAHFGARLPIPGVDLPEVTTAVDFLRQVALRGPDGLDTAGKRVLVLGGGNVAVDAAMTARRSGAAWVGMACLESRATMPAHEWEIADAAEEGIELFPSRTFYEITSAEGHVAGLRCAEIEFRGFIEGRPDFDELPGTTQKIEADLIIFAIGQRPDLACLPDESRVRGRFAAADPHTLATGVPGLFAGGDAVTGTAFVVDAIAAGHRAARSIEAYLRDEPLPLPAPEVEVVELSDDEVRAIVLSGQASQASRYEPAKAPAAERARSFGEIYGPLTEEQARAEAARCLSCGVCAECLQCEYACQKHCIDHSMREEIVDLSVGAVVLAPGLETIPGSIRPELGYGRCDNVVTSIEFERMLSASGPWSGLVQRPSDSKHPQRLAFIQCVGSRDVACEQGYCSSICCMVATKEAVIAREHDHNVRPTIFTVDIRSFGKDFERYVERAEQDLGVRTVRSMVSTVTEVPGTGDLRVRYATADGKNVEEVFDLVVLSVGLRPPAGARELAKRLRVALNEYGFAEAPPYAPGQVTGLGGGPAPGIYAAGAFSEPKDIPETVIEASCAAAQASALLASARGTLTQTRVWPEERDVYDELPRVGVFVCHCGINIGSVVDVPDVVATAAGMPGVAFSEHSLYTCSQDTQDRIRERIEEHDLNRVVVASCTPRTHEPLFQETIRGAGLNPHLFQMANIREQVSWVHRADHAGATEKAKELVRMAVAKAERLHAIGHSTFGVVHRALVIGGGLAGMTAALSIADQGYSVTLVEREPILGGNLRHILMGLPERVASPGAGQSTDPQALLEQTIEAVTSTPRISVLTGAAVVALGGYVGQYRTIVRRADGVQEEIEHGVTVVATGARQIEPCEYLYGDHPGVITQREFEQTLAAWQHGGPAAQPEELPGTVVMIQCVGSRDKEHPYCSRVCCTEALKNALVLKALSPETDVVVLYRDLRSFGFKERHYYEARRQGVVFLQVDAAQKPEVRAIDGQLDVSMVVQPENERCSFRADLVVLSAGIEPNGDNDAVARLLKVPLSEDGFFLEAHAKLRPLDFAADGIYLCGMAHSPRFLAETIAQAQGAAIRAVSLLSKEELAATPIVVRVNPRLCAACGLCVEVCPYGARVLEPGSPTAEVIEVLCQGCGACVTACPNKASQQKGFEVAQVYGMLDCLNHAQSLNHVNGMTAVALEGV